MKAADRRYDSSVPPRRTTPLPVVVLPRIRFQRGPVIVLGPGKADLLEAVARTGSIRAAATELGMSYMRAWSLVRVMNTEFRSPLVHLVRGGPDHGGAVLTPAGTRVATLYREMEQAALDAVAPGLERLRRDLLR